MRIRQYVAAVFVAAAGLATVGVAAAGGKAAQAVGDSGQFAGYSGQYVADSGQEAVDSGQEAVDSGQYAADSGQYAADSGQEAADSGQYVGESGQADDACAADPCQILSAGDYNGCGVMDWTGAMMLDGQSARCDGASLFDINADGFVDMMELLYAAPLIGRFYAALPGGIDLGRTATGCVGGYTLDKEPRPILQKD